MAKLLGLIIVGLDNLKAFLKKFSLRTYGTVAVILLCAILLLDVGYHFSQGFTSSFDTMSARIGSISETVSFDAYIVREEKLFGSDSSKKVYYVADGERVKNGTELVAIYPDTVDSEVLEELERTMQAISLLRSVNDARPEKVSETIELRIEGITLEIDEAIREGNIAKANRRKDTLSALMLAKERLIGLTDLSSVIASLEKSVSSLKKTLGNPKSVLKASESGWFSYSLDGYENVVTPDNLLKMEYGELVQLFDEKQASSGGGVGKMITSHKIYAVTFVDLETASYFVTGRQYKVSLDDGTLDLTLEKTIRKDGEEQIALVFSSLSLADSLAMDRIVNMSLTVETHEGFQIPTSAYVVYKGVHGVFVLKGFVVQFREVSVVYRKDSMLIAEVSPKDKSGLFKLLAENDNIIIKGEDLYDGKIVQGAS